jgi:hypothetical protein
MAVPVKEVVVTFEDGLVSSESPLSRDAGMEVLTNAWISRFKRGALECASGFSSKVSAAKKMYNGGYYNNAANTDSLCWVSAEDRVYNVDPGTGAETDLKTGLTADKIEFSAALQDFACFVNGTDTPFKSEIKASSPTVSNMGLTRLDTSSAASARGSAGRVTGTVLYWVSDVAADGFEGPLSAPFGQIDARDGFQIDLTLVPTGASGTVRIYRTFADGSAPYLVESVTGTPSSTLSYTDNIPDNRLGNPPLQHGDPPLSSFKFLISHLSYLFAIDGGTSRLYWSDLNEPESWYIPGNTEEDYDQFGNYVDVFGDDGDILTAATRVPEGLLLFKQNHLYLLRGKYTDEFLIDEITLSDQSSRTVGVADPRYVQSTPYGIFFYYQGGVYRYLSGTVTYVSREIENLIQEDAVIGFGPQAVKDTQIALGYWRRKNWLCFSIQNQDNDPDTNLYPNHTFFYDLTFGKWVGEWNFGFKFFFEVENGTDIEFWGGGGGAPGSGGDKRTEIYELDDTQTFAGSNISCVATLPVFYGGAPNILKRFMYADIYFEPQASGSFTVRYEIDGKSTDTDTASVSQVEASTDYHQHRVNMGLIGRDLQLSFESNANQPPFRILGVTYGYQDLVSKSQ